ncbi:MAG: hypothetical protein ABI155_13770, partial [Paralcaligenes sp.]
NIDFFQPVQGFKERMGALISQLHSSEALSEIARIYYPGERSYLQKLKLLEDKEAAVDQVVWESIVALQG